MSADISQLLQTGLQHHQSGRLLEAEAVYQSLIKEHPEQPDAWHLLGVLAHQTGNSELAVKLIEKAIAISPGEADFHNNCGEAWRAQHKFDKAIDCFEKALSIRPDFAGAHNNIGNILKEEGKLEESIESYKQAIASEPNFFMAHNNLGIVLKELGKPEQALACFEKALSIMPRYAEAINNLGNVLQELGRSEQAIVQYQRAIELMPGSAETHSNLGNALRDADRQQEAIDQYEKAISINPEFAMAHYNLGIALEEFRRPQEAISSYERAIALQPDYAEACNNLGFALQELGRRDDAISRYQQAVSIKPDYAAAHLHLSMIVPKQDQITVIEKLLETASVSTIDASLFHFALGNIYNHLQKYEQAFQHYSKGNELKRNTINYKPDNYTAHVDRLLQTFTPDYFAGLAEIGSDSDLPVFIVGLPRSGSTLIEQILSSHAQVYGAGELVLMSGIEKSLTSQVKTSSQYIECMSKINGASADLYAEQYLQEIRSYAADAARITDKDPGNFHRIGLIKTLFPKAGIIHCRRNPVDTCLSIFFNYFSEGNEYSFKLEELGQYYLDYERLMAHWCKLFPADILEVNYEDLVRDQERVSRQLLDHIGLPWDKACLDFHLNKRPVRTASSVQVRQPLYTQSIERWKHYQAQLAPLLEILQEKS